MILGIAGLPAPREDNTGVRLVLRASEHLHVLGRVRDQGCLRILDPVRVLKNGGEALNSEQDQGTRGAAREPRNWPLRRWTRSEKFIGSGESARCLRPTVRRAILSVGPDSFLSLFRTFSCTYSRRGGLRS